MDDKGVIMEKKKIIIYYAHPKTHYDTNLEYECLEFLHTTFGAYSEFPDMDIEIFNPNEPIISKLYQNRKDNNHPDRFEIFREFARASDILVMTSFLDGYLGSGVAEEGDQALCAEKKVFLLSFVDLDGYTVKCLQLIKNFDGLKLLSYEETVERINNGVQ